MNYVKTVFPLAAVVSGVLLASAGVAQADASCLPTGMVKDGRDLTAAQIHGTVSGELIADGCDIGVYNPTDVTGAKIHGATQYGVYVDGKDGVYADGKEVNVRDADVYDIGDDEKSGMQYGVGIYYTNGAKGTISDNEVSDYQKGGIVVKESDTDVKVTDNTVTGLGAVKFIAQNGIQVSGGAAATLTGNTVSKNQYTGGGWTASGILIYQADPTMKAGKIASTNDVFKNQANIAYVK